MGRAAFAMVSDREDLPPTLDGVLVDAVGAACGGFEADGGREEGSMTIIDAADFIAYMADTMGKSHSLPILIQDAAGSE
jgi:hypothetical protein